MALATCSCWAAMALTTCMRACLGLGSMHMGLPACLQEVLCACWDAQRRLFRHAHVHVASPLPLPLAKLCSYNPFLNSFQDFREGFQQSVQQFEHFLNFYDFSYFFGFQKSLKKKNVETRLENFPPSRLDFS